METVFKSSFTLMYMVVLYSDNASEECYLQDDVRPKWLCKNCLCQGPDYIIRRRSQHVLSGRLL